MFINTNYRYKPISHEMAMASEELASEILPYSDLVPICPEASYEIPPKSSWIWDESDIEGTDDSDEAGCSGNEPTVPEVTRLRKENEKIDRMRNPPFLKQPSEYDSDDEWKDRRVDIGTGSMGHLAGMWKADLRHFMRVLNPEVDEVRSRIVEKAFENIKENAKILKPLQSRWFTLKISFLQIRFDIWRRVIVPATISLAALHDQILCPLFCWPRDEYGYLFRLSHQAYANEKKPWVPSKDISFGPVNARHDDMMRRSYRRGGAEMVDDNLVALMDVLNKPGHVLKYMFHFVQRWHVAIQLEAISSGVPSQTIEVLNGKGAAPVWEAVFTIHDYFDQVEDIVGPRAYCMILDILLNPEEWHPSWKKSAEKKIAEYKRCIYIPITFPQKEYKITTREYDSPFDPSYCDLEAANNQVKQCVKLPRVQQRGISGMEVCAAMFACSPNPQRLQNLMAGRRLCDFCKKSESQLKKKVLTCSRCKGAFYCSQECQKKDWKKGHKRVCTSLK